MLHLHAVVVERVAKCAEMDEEPEREREGCQCAERWTEDKSEEERGMEEWDGAGSLIPPIVTGGALLMC